MTLVLLRSLAVMIVVALFSAACDRVTPSAPETKTKVTSAASIAPGLWQVYDQSLKNAST
jgi:sarcosine oxidase gamma subunit